METSENERRLHAQVSRVSDVGPPLRDAANVELMQVIRSVPLLQLIDAQSLQHLSDGEEIVAAEADD
jgi:hypothetical protein